MDAQQGPAARRAERTQSWDDKDRWGEYRTTGGEWGTRSSRNRSSAQTGSRRWGGLAESDGGLREARLQARLAAAEAEPAGGGAAGWMVAGCTLAGQRVSFLMVARRGAEATRREASYTLL